MVILIYYYIESLLQFENDHTGSQKAQKKTTLISFMFKKRKYRICCVFEKHQNGISLTIEIRKTIFMLTIS